MEKVKESMGAAVEALQQMYVDIERVEKEIAEYAEVVEETALFEPMKVETMLALLKDGSVEAMSYARPHLIEFLEDYIEQKYIEDERLGKLEDNVATAFWIYDEEEIVCSECGQVNFDGKIYDQCPCCDRRMTNTSLVAEQIIFDGVKSAALCHLCAYGNDCCHLGHQCEDCEQSTHCCGERGEDYVCRCDLVPNGVICEYFKRKEDCKCHCSGCSS